MPGTKTHSPDVAGRSGPGELGTRHTGEVTGPGERDEHRRLAEVAPQLEATGRFAGDVVDVGVGRDEGVVGIHLPAHGHRRPQREAHGEGQGRHPFSLGAAGDGPEAADHVV